MQRKEKSQKIKNEKKQQKQQQKYPSLAQFIFLQCITVKPPFSGHSLKPTPLCSRNVSQEQKKRQPSSYNETSMQRTLYSGHFLIEDIIFRSQFTLPPRTDLSIADTPKKRPNMTFLVTSLYVFYFRRFLRFPLSFL